jgi:hypothetical protein
MTTSDAVKVRPAFFVAGRERILEPFDQVSFEAFEINTCDKD